jgi:hypothetical protein
MSTTEDSGAVDTVTDPGYYENAREYALDRLDENEPTSPAELSEEYGCTGDHARKTLAELADEGVVERVSRGNYTLDGAVEAGKDALDGAADTAADALDQLGDGDNSGGDADAPAAPLPMEPKKLAKILAVALVLWLVYRRLSDGGTDDANAADVEDDGDDLDGGLIG